VPDKAITDWTENWGRSCLAPLDMGAEYLRLRLFRVLPLYLLAMAPFTVAMFFLIDIISARHRSALAGACFFLALTTLWRWVGLAALQRRVQHDVSGSAPSPLRKRLFGILLTRLYAAIALTWGSFLVLPGLYGFFLAVFTTPALLEGETPALLEIKKTLSLIHRSLWRLMRCTTALSVAVIIVLFNLIFLQVDLVNTILPSILGINVTDLALTMSNLAWFLVLGYALFLMFDFYWNVSSVMLYYDLQARRLGSDLRLRLQSIHAADQ